MSPRALVSALAGTTFGFALIISSVAGSTISAGAQVSDPPGAIAQHTMHAQPYQALAAGEDRLVAWNTPCEIAL